MASKKSSLRNDFTSTGYVVNPEFSKILLVLHKKLGRWLPPGGHWEKNELPHMCAIREVEEETGIHAEIVPSETNLGLESAQDKQIPEPYCILHELIPASGKDVEHMHVDFIYIMIALESSLTPQLKEIANAQWFTKQDLLIADTFPAVRAIGKKILR